MHREVRAGFSEEGIVELEDEQDFSRSKGGGKSIAGVGNCVCKGPGVRGQHDQEASVSGSDKVRENMVRLTQGLGPGQERLRGHIGKFHLSNKSTGRL